MNLVTSRVGGEVDLGREELSPSQPAEEPRRWTYQPPLDGLRAVAVTAVFAYHLAAEYAPTPVQWERTPQGGFLGVDTFFVLSGFLITTLLLAEYRTNGTISLASFWGRRARRLLPALFLVLVAVAGYAAWFARPEELDSLRGDLFGTLTYWANWRFIYSGESYFTLFTDASPLRHAWSLAIEEQFYLVWPLVAFVCLRWARGRRTVFAAVCVAGAVASALTMARLYASDDLSRAYYGTDGHAQLLLIGALLAILLAHWSARPSFTPAIHAAGVIGGLYMLWAFSTINDADSWMYRGGYAIFGLAVAALIASLVQAERTPQRRLLSLAPIVWLGRISYGVYLWHWPVIVVASPDRTGFEGPTLLVLRVASTLALATLSFYLVELPIREGRLFRRRWSLAFWPAAFVVTALLAVFATSGAAPVPAYLREATEIFPAENGESAGIALTTPPERVLFAGDSIATSLVSGLEKEAAARGLELSVATIPGCGVVRGTPTLPDGALIAGTGACDATIVGYQTDAVARANPQLVVWHSIWEILDRVVDGKMLKVGTPEGDQRLAALLEESATRMQAGGARLAIVVPARSNADASLLYSHTEQRKRLKTLKRLLRAQARRHPDTTAIIDLGKIVCPTGSPCPHEVDGVDLRPDGSHFESEGADYVARRLVPKLVTVLRQPVGIPVQP